MRPLLLSLVVAFAFLLPTAASAGPNDNSNKRPWAFNVGMGPVINLESGGALGKFAPDFHYHFKKGDVGPALGAEMHMHFAAHIFGMNIGPTFLWDFRVYQGGKFKLYLAPLVALGYGFSAFVPGGGAGHFFFMDFGGQLKGMFNDRAGFFIRPLTFSLLAGEGGATGTWTLIMGGSFSF